MPEEDESEERIMRLYDNYAILQMEWNLELDTQAELKTKTEDLRRKGE